MISELFLSTMYMYTVYLTINSIEFLNVFGLPMLQVFINYALNHYFFKDVVSELQRCVHTNWITRASAL